MLYPLWERSLLFLFPAGKTKQNKRSFCFICKSPLSGGLQSARTCCPLRHTLRFAGQGEFPLPALPPVHKCQLRYPNSPSVTSSQSNCPPKTPRSVRLQVCRDPFPPILLNMSCLMQDPSRSFFLFAGWQLAPKCHHLGLGLQSATPSRAEGARGTHCTHLAPTYAVEVTKPFNSCLIHSDSSIQEALLRIQNAPRGGCVFWKRSKPSLAGRAETLNLRASPMGDGS